MDSRRWRGKPAFVIERSSRLTGMTREIATSDYLLAIVDVY